MSYEEAYRLETRYSAHGIDFCLVGGLNILHDEQMLSRWRPSRLFR